jgi:hypothetical protein
MILVVEAEQAESVVFEQRKVEPGYFIQLQQHGEDTILETVMPGPQPAMHHPSFI